MQKLCFLEGGSAIILGGREGLNHVRFMLNFLCEGVVATKFVLGLYNK